MSSQQARSYLFAMISPGLLLIVGCSSSVPNQTEVPKHQVTGNVTIDGAPPAQSPDPTSELFIAFVKMEGNARPADKDILDFFGVNFDQIADPGEGDLPLPPGMEGDEAGAKQLKIEEGAVSVDTPGAYQTHLNSGKYLVVVRYFPQGIGNITGSVDRADRLKGRYSAQNSDLIVEVNEDKTFDLNLKTK